MIHTDQRTDAIARAIGALEKQYGQGTVMRLGDRGAQAVEVISTGAPSLDKAIGVGGYPRGRIAEIYGPESSGKTTLTLHAIASCQQAGGTAAFVDAEHALDPLYAAALGVDLDHLLVAQPDDGEQALDVVEGLVSSGAVDLVVVDSVAALVPRSEIEGAMADQSVGLQARLMSRALRKLAGVVSKHKACVIFINQLRQKIGVTYGSNETTTGGNALKFYASVRLDVRRIGSVKKGEDSIGNQTRVRVVKNKLAPPFRQVEFDILFGKGISVTGDLIDQAERLGILHKSGTWYSFGDEKLGQGREKVREIIESRPEMRDRITALVASAAQDLEATA